MTNFNNVMFASDGIDFLSMKGADVVILGAPFDLGATTSGGGMATAPTAVRNSYTNFRLDQNVSVVDAGDIACTERSVRGACHDVAVATEEMLMAGAGTVVIIGGDDSINYGAATGLPKPLHAMHFDAHDDCYVDPEMEDQLDHSSWARMAVEEGHLLGIYQHGVRTPVNTAVPNIVQSRLVVPAIDPDVPLFVAIDMDVVDPAFAPGVGTPEPGGITSNELLKFCNTLGKTQAVQVLTFTEYVPAKDINGATARLIFRCITNYILGYAGVTIP